MHILTRHEREELEGRRRRRVKCKGRRAYRMNICADRPGRLAKMRTCMIFAEKIMRQLDRYGSDVDDVRRLRRLAALLNGLADQAAGQRRRKVG